ncbi:MAG: DUF302 domain-containing protein, partial [Solirubrobacteraceae bacterium]
AMITATSHYDFHETLQRLLDALEHHQLTVFAQIDHAGAARAADLVLADEQVVVFGSPKAGTVLMQTDPRVGIDLPLKILVWQGGDGVLVGYNDPLELADHYDISEHRSTLEAMSQLLAQLAEQTTT